MLKKLERVIREKVRWDSSKGILSIEQLWDIPLNIADTMAMALVEITEAKKRGSFLKPKVENTLDELRLSILIYIIETRQAEIAAKEQAIIKEQEKKEWDKLIAEKKYAGRKEMTLEEMQKHRDSL